MIYIVVAALLVVLDQVVKFLVRTTMVLGDSMVLIPDVLGITYVQNTGAAFSSFPNATMVLAGISLLVSLLLILAILLRWVRHPFGRFTLMLLLAGAVGNLIDRAVMGYVTDMVQVLFVKFAVFNLADVFVVTGAILLVLYVIFGWDRCERVHGKRERGKGKRSKKK
ncbi:MAG: signal peptidase II [Clostridiales bacterium]|jgi:signal peptidase II|nr:MAG: signal peptidase II [Clostridiales bacterium]